MSKPILLSSSQLRIDGRRALELRPMSCRFGISPASDGSASLSQGLTHVEACVNGPRDGRYVATRVQGEAATLNLNVQFAPFSGNDRRKRSKNDRKVQELATSLKNTFEPAITLSLYPRSSIDISLLILNQDGSLLSASINAVTLALVHAGIALTSPVSAVSISVLHDTALLDPCSPEESELPTVTAACMAPLGSEETGKVTLVALENRLTIERFEALLRLASKAAAIVSQEIESVSKDFARQTLRALDGAKSHARHADDVEDHPMVDG